LQRSGDGDAGGTETLARLEAAYLGLLRVIVLIAATLALLAAGVGS
jgi:hypothetical protein